MLKCLELVGFKSFADKTRIEFDEGITAIVGPNGSGKSNVVDAIRWILGEQSAKSLRGNEMADVIFNGSGSRKSLGVAEVSLFLDNRKGFLPLESSEVVLTRRVYRGGEGEYLINRQPARLRDIRDLFLGTGAGAGAYSIIEQGKVESMLQASAKDRRHILEEAAGVSKFKARKIETLRRLDRVEQNLLRVRDIHEEVEKQLRTLRSQASKAKRAAELTQQLREIRLRAGLARYHEHVTRLDASRERLERVARDADARAEELAREQADLHETVRRLQEREAALDAMNRTMLRLRDRLLGLSAEQSSDRRQWAEHQEQLDQCRAELEQARPRIRRLELELSERRQESDRVEEGHQAIADQTRRLDEKRRWIDQELDVQRKALADRQLEVNADLQRIARAELEQSALESQFTLLWHQKERMETRRAQLRQSSERVSASLANAVRSELMLRSQLSAFRSSTLGMRRSLDEVQSARDECLRRLAQLRDERRALASQRDVLQRLHQQFEGLDSGVQKALELREQGNADWKQVLGPLADHLRVSGEWAPLIDLALGSRSGALVVLRSEELTPDLIAQARSLAGRVQLLVVDGDRSEPMVVYPDQIPDEALSSRVDCPPELRPLVDRILGSTFVFDEWPTAWDASRSVPGIRVVTAAGELIEPDGAIHVGPISTQSGRVSRAAEIRELGQRLDSLDEESANLEVRSASLENDLAERRRALEEIEDREQTIATQRRHFEELRTRPRQQHQGLANELGAVESELDRTRQDIESVDRQSRDVDHRLTALHDALKRTTDTIEALQPGLAELEAQGAAASAELAAVQTQWAVIEERRAALRQRVDRLQADLQERLAEHVSGLDRRASRQLQLARIEQQLLDRAAELASVYLEMEQSAERHGVDPREIADLRAERDQRSGRVESARETLERLREARHAEELEATRIRLAQENLVARIREDYQVDLADLWSREHPPDPTLDLEACEREARELKDRLSRLGAVHWSAVEELQELELRSETLRFQVADLESGREHIQTAIAKINEESRRLFLDTFESVREHFQDIFRKLFGGGKADLVLEDEADLLDAGIEIVARPPGKEPRAISQLSGGEKTLTAVALLLALFRSKPSPFCILDEVDAALDEANIGRFIELLREFLSISQFLLVTHSKTTMARADVLHGITQRESGVSTRISVRLDSVGANGEILDNGATGDPLHATIPLPPATEVPQSLPAAAQQQVD